MASAITGYARNSSPLVHCLAVDSVGDVTVTWTIPADANAAFFSNYTIYWSTSKTGPYAAVVIPVMAQTTATINATGANGAPVYFYMLTDDSQNGYSAPLDTLSTIFLTATPVGGRAILTWNALHTPNIPTASGWYKIYREFPQYVWTLIDSTQNLLYIDTVRICQAFINYKIEESDASGCTSISNRSGNNFTNIIAPPIAVMDTLSVSPGNALYVSWNQSSYKDVIGYVIYEFKGGWKAIDTVWGLNDLSDTILNANPDSASIPICVAALDSCGHVGPLSNQQNSLFLKDVPDSCTESNLLKWNKYVGLIPGVAEYKVWVSLNGGKFSLMSTTTDTSFVQTGLRNVATYCYFVQVVDQGLPVATASSNVICYTVKIPPIPSWSYLQTATVVNNAGVQVNCYVDNSAHCTDYTLLRSNSFNGPYKAVANLTSPGVYISFSDPTANVDNQSYYYKVTTQNACGLTVDSTQVGQTIYLTALGDATGVNTLTWNDYIQWAKGDSIYYIYRAEDNGPFSLITTIPYTSAGTNVYKDDVSAIITGQGIFSYYITALEKPSWYPFLDTSMSNIAEAYQDPRVYIPSAFSPLGKNKIFIPIGVYVDVTGYDFQVFDRMGQLVFETQDQNVGWNGKYGGSVCMEGVYVYRLVYTSSKGEYFERKGTVTLIK